MTHSIAELRALKPADMTDDQLAAASETELLPGMCIDCFRWVLDCMRERGDRVLARHREVMQTLMRERGDRVLARHREVMQTLSLHDSH